MDSEYYENCYYEIITVPATKEELREYFDQIGYEMDRDKFGAEAVND